LVIKNEVCNFDGLTLNLLIMAFKWTCPYCNHDTTIVDSNYKKQSNPLSIPNVDGLRVLDVKWIVCPNEECNKFTLEVVLFDCMWENENLTRGQQLEQWNLIPQSTAKVFPDYIPPAIRTDYKEACSIKDLSPKASATLARRCLQGMIHDFYGVVKKNLYKEIMAIKNLVDPLTWQAIDATRKIGNIDAYMKEDIDLIIDVEPEEAQVLINLIEILIKDWYIIRHEREQMLNSIVSIAYSKAEQKETKSDK